MALRTLRSVAPAWRTASALRPSARSAAAQPLPAPCRWRRRGGRARGSLGDCLALRLLGCAPLSFGLRRAPALRLGRSRHVRRAAACSSGAGVRGSPRRRQSMLRGRPDSVDHRRHDEPERHDPGQDLGRARQVARRNPDEGVDQRPRDQDRDLDARRRNPAMTALPLVASFSADRATCSIRTDLARWHIHEKCGSLPQSPMPHLPNVRACLPGSFDEGMTTHAIARQGAKVGPCRLAFSPPSPSSAPWRSRAPTWLSARPLPQPSPSTFSCSSASSWRASRLPPWRAASRGRSSCR